jgi:hypothetical protein
LKETSGGFMPGPEAPIFVSDMSSASHAILKRVTCNSHAIYAPTIRLPRSKNASPYGVLA